MIPLAKLAYQVIIEIASRTDPPLAGVFSARTGVMASHPARQHERASPSTTTNGELVTHSQPGFTSDELLDRFPEATWRSKYVALMDVFDLLTECVIGHDYTIPDAMSDALHLTEEGSKLFDQLVRKEKVPPKEARLMTALTVGHRELFIDVEATNLDDLVASVSKQLQDLRIRLPFVHGRMLYDVFAELFPTEKDTLSVAETFDLLDALPIGVFQHGEYVSGPFGLLKARTKRNIPASRRVPAFHCEQASCDVVHGANLTTSQEALINANRDRVRKILEADANLASEWDQFARAAAGFDTAFFADTRSGSVTPLLADCLSDDELRALFCALLDGYEGQLRKNVQPVIGGGNASMLADPLNRAQLLQLLFLADEQHIATALDVLVAEGVIRVPLGEVRVPKMSGRARSGAFRLGAELGSHGHRLASTDAGFASLRLRRLLDDLYDLSEPSQRDELAWQLRSVESGELSEQLETFFRSTDPRQVIEQLAFARRANVDRVAESLSLTRVHSLSDEDLISTILWKLGFQVPEEYDPHGAFWNLFTKCASLTESLRVSGIGDSEEFRGTASVFFSELEGLLQGALAFASWALLVDHPSQPEPFTYDKQSDFTIGINFVNQAFDDRANEAESLHIDPEKPELYVLLRGFSTLASYLASLDVSQHMRDLKAFPEYYEKTELKDFVFTHTHPFLDLLETSQARLVEGLDQIGSVMIAADVNDVRNHYAHYRRLSPDIEKMSRALDAIRKAVEQIELLGVSPIAYWWDGQETDRWGRTQAHMVAPKGKAAVFAMPTRFDWMGLPSLRRTQYLVRSAVFAEPNEILRFEPRFASEFTSYWSGIPNRRRKIASVEARDASTGEHRSASGLLQ